MSHLICQGCGEDLGDRTWSGACPHCGATRVLRVGDADDAFVGRLVSGRWRIVRKLGQGGMGRVFLAEQTELGQQVALKFLNVDLVRDVALARRFLQEARSAARVSHPHAVGVHDFGQDEDGNLYIAMEYVEGVDLRRLLGERGRLPAAEAAEIALQAADVLAHAHARGVVHRDLKPENVMVQAGMRGFHVKVLDFGIAKLLDDPATRATVQSALTGTPRYMAPEQIEGRGVDARSDVYALGLVLFELLTGRTPFEAPSVAEVLRRQLEEPVPRLAEVAPELDAPGLDAVIGRATAKSPEDRFPDMASFARGLAEAVARAPGGVSVARETPARREETAPAMPPHPVPEPGRFARWAVALGLAAGLALAVLVWRLGATSPAPEAVVPPAPATAVAPEPAPPPAAPSPKRVEAAGLSFLLPEGWLNLSPGAPAESFASVPPDVAARAREPGVAAFAVAPEGTELYRPELRVERLDDTTPVTAARVRALADDIVARIQGVPGARASVLAADEITVEGAPSGRVLVSLTTPTGQSLRLVSFLFARDGHAALLSFDAAAEQLERLAPVFDASAAATLSLAAPDAGR